MELNIIIGGKAGQGIQKISEILGKAFAKCGYYVFMYRDYQSLIKGGHNYNALKISDEFVGSHEEEDIDFLIALDENTVRIHEKKLKENGYIICDKNINAKNKIEVDIKEILKEANAKEISSNVVLISVLWRTLGLPKEILKEVINKELKGEENLKIVDIVFERFEEKYKLEVKKGKKYFINGSEGIALGALLSEIDFYISYPYTPSTQVLHILSEYIPCYIPDNEIGGINMALGISYAGKK